MTFDELLEQIIALLQRDARAPKGGLIQLKTAVGTEPRFRLRVSYRVLKRRFDLDDEYLEDLRAELIQAQRLAVDEDGAVLNQTTRHSYTSSLAVVPVAVRPGGSVPISVLGLMKNTCPPGPVFSTMLATYPPHRHISLVPLHFSLALSLSSVVQGRSSQDPLRKEEDHYGEFQPIRCLC